MCCKYLLQRQKSIHFSTAYFFMTIVTFKYKISTFKLLSNGNGLSFTVFICNGYQKY